GLARAERSSDLLVGQPGHHSLHHFPLARRERLETAPKALTLRPMVASGAIAFQRSLDGIEELLFAERLGQKLDRAGFHRLHGHRDVTVSRDEDDGNTDPSVRHPLLEIETAQARHPHVEHNATGSVSAFAAEELMGGGEGFDANADRSKKVIE